MGRTRDVNAAVRAKMAIELRMKKMTYEEIAKRCGYASRGACHDAVQRELGRNIAEDVDELRREELASIDKVYEDLWDEAMNKENKYRLFAVDRLIQLSKLRMELMGLAKSGTNNIAAAQVVIRQYDADVESV